MKKILCLILSLVFTFSVFGQQPKNPGTTSKKVNNDGYFDKDPIFKINFFGNTPSKTETPVETAVGTIYMTSYMYEKSYEEVYMLAISAFPEKHIESSNTSELLENTKGGFCSNLNLDVNISKTI